MENITNFDFKELNKFNKIFVLVSGGIDSTYLLEIIKESCDRNKIYPVNCFNPYETSKCLDKLKKERNYIEIKPKKVYDYKEILKQAFLNLPKARELKRLHKYSKKVFNCCYLIKHKAFMKYPMFKEENTCVVSGIKYSDGRQRNLWLKSLRTGITTTKGTVIIDPPTFYHRHKGGQLYCYPFRDFKEKEFSENVMNELREKYPNISHSGCAICPVLVLFESRIKNEPRQKASIEYAKLLNVY